MPVRLLLCRPQAGLTDILSRIGRCARYADTYDRHLVVEMNFNGAQHFRDDFSYYFVSHDRQLTLSSAKYGDRFDHLKTCPASFTGRVNSYKAKYSRAVEAIADIETGQIPSFDFSKDHIEPLLLYHASGGGLRKAEIALRRISLSAEVRREVLERLSRLDARYTSIHIRNTDFATDYRSHLEAIKNEISGPIYVATDNREVLDYCSKIFGKKQVSNFASLPYDSGKPIHSNQELDARQSNIDAIADLILLASAKRYYFFPISNAKFSGLSYSGYSKLAELLHKDKALLRQFINADSFGTIARMRLKLRKVIYRGLGFVSSLMPTVGRKN